MNASILVRGITLTSSINTSLLQPKINNRRLRLALAAVADQSWLSLLNLSVSFGFIRTASKAEYGLFLMVQAIILMMQGIQNALFISPLATVLPASVPSRKTALKNTAIIGQGTVAMISAACCGFGLLLYRYAVGQNLDLLLAAACAIAILGASAREGVRAFHYVEGNTSRALSADISYGLLLLLPLAVLAGLNMFSATNVLLSMGFAGLIPLAHGRSPKRLPRPDRQALNEFWACGRWSLPAVVATWLNLNAYVYFVAAILGAAALADINTARLFLMPVGLAITAWSNFVRPKISRLVSERDVTGVRRITSVSLALSMSALALLVAMLFLFYPVIENVLGKKYHGLQPLVIGWCVFFVANITRTIYMATLMSAASGYRKLHHISWLTTLLVVIGMWSLTTEGECWVVGVLCCGEVFSCAAIFIETRRAWGRIGG